MALSPESASDAPAAAFELRAASFTLPVVRLLGVDMEIVAEQLSAKVDQAPDFFRNTPVVIDLSGLESGAGELEFPMLVGLMRGYAMIPVGVRGGTSAQHKAAEAMELAILSDAFVRRTRSVSKAARPEPRKPEPQAPEKAKEGKDAAPDEATLTPPASSFKLVTRPVRSGQRVYAAGGDLSVVAAVSSGAELMADGNIHVYGPLRGRAMAGMKGDLGARIFCQNLQAELVSVAGHYRVSENIPAKLKGVPVQVFLEQESLRIKRL